MCILYQSFKQYWKISNYYCFYKLLLYIIINKYVFNLNKNWEIRDPENLQRIANIILVKFNNLEHKITLNYENNDLRNP